MEEIRQHIIFTGRVQGVGFRYRAKYAAAKYALTGWGRNDWDGSVEMEVQGISGDIDRMIRDIAAGSYIAIEGLERNPLPLQPEEKKFRVLG